MLHILLKTESRWTVVQLIVTFDNGFFCYIFFYTLWVWKSCELLLKSGVNVETTQLTSQYQCLGCVWFLCQCSRVQSAVDLMSVTLSRVDHTGVAVDLEPPGFASVGWLYCNTVRTWGVADGPDWSVCLVDSPPCQTSFEIMTQMLSSNVRGSTSLVSRYDGSAVSLGSQVCVANTARDTWDWAEGLFFPSIC